MNSPVDPQLKAIHQAALVIYNRETEIIRVNPTSVVSSNAANFLAGQATSFADAALFLMEDARQPLNIPVALLRTCLEAQARANHMVAVHGAEREQRASEITQMMQVGHDYYETLVIQTTKDFGVDESKFLPRDRAYIPAIKSMLASRDTSNLKSLKEQHEDMNRRWSYSKVIGKDKFGDKNWQARSEAQPLQPMLYLDYIKCCSFVHSNPASLKLEPLLTPVGVAYAAVLAEVIAILCFFVALGKEKDQGLLDIKCSLKAFDANEKILPKKHLAAQ